MSTSSASALPDSSLYRRVWRWHFYAGLLCLPILVLMAVTGALYLYKDAIESRLDAGWHFVPPTSGPGLDGESLVQRALAAQPGSAVRFIPPAASGRSAEVGVRTDGGVVTVYLDPADGRVLGQQRDDRKLMEVIKRLHSLVIAGPVANHAVEIVAGWAIVLVATGVFLWWPRGRGGGVVTVRGTPAKRMFWRDLHAVTGVFAGLVIVFLAVTGMPWSAVWGKEVRQLTTQAGWGRPRPPVAQPHHAGEAPSEGVPWALQAHAAPASGHGHMSLGVDAVVAKVKAAGLTDGFTLTLPKTHGGTWTAAYMPDRVERTRTLYLDGGDGRVIADLRYRDFGPAAKVIEWGIAVHQGQQFGLANKLVMLAGCIAVWLLGVSAVVMWWKRRPKGRLAAPVPPADRRAYWGLLALVLPLAVLYPLVGASLAAVLSLDLILRRLSPRRRLEAGA